MPRPDPDHARRPAASSMPGADAGGRGSPPRTWPGTGETGETGETHHSIAAKHGIPEHCVIWSRVGETGETPKARRLQAISYKSAKSGGTRTGESSRDAITA